MFGLLSWIFPEKYLSLQVPVECTMAGVLDHLAKPKKQAIQPHPGSRSGSNDLVAMELDAAKEILAEVFGITPEEVEEMIRRRSEERMLWPEGFRLDE